MYQSVRILIVEDEFPVALDIETRLKKWGHEVLGIANNVDQALRMLIKENPQLILLDIRLKGEKTGIDLARTVAVEYGIPIIFLTAYGDRKTFEDASKTCPFAFLVKPFVDEDLRRNIELSIRHSRIKETLDLVDVLENLKSKINKDESVFFVKEGTAIRKIVVDDILYVSAMDNYVKFHLKGGEIIVHDSMTNLEKKLRQFNILRIHRSFMVSLNAIDKIVDDRVIISHHEIPMSKSYRKDLFDTLEWF